MNAILYLDRCGCSWRQLPSDFPPWQTVYWYFVRWEDQGVTERIVEVLRERGQRVIGLDASPALVAAALSAARGSGRPGGYLVADAATMPFADGSVDLVVSYNMLMDTSDVPGVVSEGARVLVPGGRMCVSITTR